MVSVSSINNLSLCNFKKTDFKARDLSFDNHTKIDSNVSSGLPESEVLKAYFLNFTGVKKPSFSYNPISSLIPDYSPLECDYGDIDKFCELYCKKLESQLMVVSKKDISNLVSRLCQKTGAPKQTVLDVLYKLTYFSSYSNLDRIQEIVDKYNIYSFDIEKYSKLFGISDSSSNAMLEYIAYAKGQVHMKSFYDLDGQKKDEMPTYAIILDSRVINMFKDFKNLSKGHEFEYDFFVQDILKKNQNDSLILLNISGWDVKCSDGKYRSASMLYGTGQLETLAQDVILRVQQGEKLDDILYSDFEQKVKNLTDKEVNIIRVPVENKKASLNDVYKNFTISSLKPADIKKMIHSYFGKDFKASIPDFLQYLDETTYVYSPDSLGLELRELYKKINSQIIKQGYKKQDTAYVIPVDCKSFSYVTGMFSKINDINTKNVLPLKSPYLGEYIQKPKIILDDVSASGETQEDSCKKLRDRLKNNNIIYSCLLQSKKAKAQQYEIKTISEHVFSDLFNIASSSLKIELCEMLKELGYGCISSSIAFPYMIPDTNNDFCARLFSKLLQNNNCRSNKAQTEFN